MRNILIVIVSILIFTGCRKEKFSTESRWLVPVLHTDLTLADLIPDSLTSKNADNSLNLVFEEKYGISNLEDILTIPDRVDSVEVTLSSLVLEDRTFTDTLTLGELYPESKLFNGQKTQLEAQDIITNNGTIIDVTEQFFKTATFNEGFIDIEIYNDLPVEAEFLEFELRNNENKEVIVSGTFTNLAPSRSVSESYSLAGKSVNGVLELLVKKIKTKASEGPVLIDVSKGLRVTFGVRDLKPQIATAIFPAQNLLERNDETKYNFGDAKLTQVVVETGFIKMKVESSIEEEIVLNYKIPNSSKEGQVGPIQKTWTIPAAEPGNRIFVEEKFPIDDFSIFMWGEDNNSPPYYNHVYNELIASINYSGIERTLSLDDKIKIEFGMVDVVPHLVIGDPGSHVFQIKDTLKVEAFKNFAERNISLDDANMTLDFYNSFGIESLITVNSIEGENTSQKKAVKLGLELTELKDPLLLGKAINGVVRVPFEKQIVLNKSNSNLKAFVENLPDKINADISANIRPNGTINQNDFAFGFSEVYLNMKLDIPLFVGIDSLKVAAKESLTLFNNEKVENIKEGTLNLFVSNDFPIEATVELEFLDESGNVLTQLFVGENNVVAAAEVDPLVGKTATPAVSELSTTVSRKKMVLLQNASSIKIYASFNTKEAKRFKMFADYGIDIKITTDVVYDKNN